MTERTPSPGTSPWTSPLVLGIETSCDDTACSLVDGRGRVLASVVSSQLAVHRPFGGVVPEIASREHLRNWPAVCDQAMARAGVGWDDLEAVAATRGPGLVGSLLVGLTLGKAIAFARGLPFFAIHHLEGHVFSPFLDPGDGSAAGEEAAEAPPSFLALVASGGHTTLYRVRPDTGPESAPGLAARRFEPLAETRDDAIGEAFDKFGKRLGLDYPQGPLVDRLAEIGDPARYPLPIPYPAGGVAPFFSYSGLKTAALLEIERLERQGILPLPDGQGEGAAPAVRDLAAGFRAAAVGQILDRLERLRRAERWPESAPGAVTLAVSGGVAANRLLRRELARWAAEQGVDLRLVPQQFSGDNAAMIAWVAAQRVRRGEPGDGLEVEAVSRLAIGGPGPGERNP